MPVVPLNRGADEEKQRIVASLAVTSFAYASIHSVRNCPPLSAVAGVVRDGRSGSATNQASCMPKNVARDSTM